MGTKLTKGELNITEGALYPALHKLEAYIKICKYCLTLNSVWNKMSLSK